MGRTELLERLLQVAVSCEATNSNLAILLRAAKAEIEHLSRLCDGHMRQAMLNGQRSSMYRAVLEKIAALDAAKDSEEGLNEWGEADCFTQAQELAKVALGAIDDSGRA